MAEKAVTALVEAGVTLMVTGGTISNICLHYLEQYKIMAVKIASKFELKRLARAAGASVLAKLTPPGADDLGRLDKAHVFELGSEKLVIFEKSTENCKLSTIVIRGSTRGLMDDIERAIDDSVSVYRSALHSRKFVPGAGSSETLISAKLEQEGKQITGLDQYSYSRFGKAFEIIPKVLAENAGLDSNEFIANFITANLKEPSGLNVELGVLVPVSESKVYDHLDTKLNAIRLAAEAAITVLRIDQIIIAKPSGGPKMKGENKNWDNDD
jgi:T-complex protein 1 subunit theta